MFMRQLQVLATAVIVGGPVKQQAIVPYKEHSQGITTYHSCGVCSNGSPLFVYVLSNELTLKGQSLRLVYDSLV